ncbi:MAG TPA: HAD-IA family hydrolase [Prolixibacteraceae bacterium]|jgi:putative hydrolase of the HAD superfamily
MDQTIPITTLFLDIGGVLLSNGWGHESRKLAAETFHLDEEEMEYRHRFNVVKHEEGNLTLSEYLNRVVFYEKRSFTPDQFKEFMFKQSTPNGKMIEFIKQLKEQYKLKIAVINNEGRVLNEYRIRKFQLSQFVDYFISSCFVHFRKPDTDIFRLALDVTQVSAEQAVYIEDLQSFVDVARTLGIKSIPHKNNLATTEVLATLGLKIG